MPEGGHWSGVERRDRQLRMLRDTYTPLSRLSLSDNDPGRNLCVNGYPKATGARVS
jgi:hypothetical protein